MSQHSNQDNTATFGAGRYPARSRQPSERAASAARNPQPEIVFTNNNDDLDLTLTLPQGVIDAINRGPQGRQSNRTTMEEVPDEGDNTQPNPNVTVQGVPGGFPEARSIIIGRRSQSPPQDALVQRHPLTGQQTLRRDPYTGEYLRSRAPSPARAIEEGPIPEDALQRLREQGAFGPRPVIEPPHEEEERPLAELYPMEPIVEQIRPASTASIRSVSSEDTFDRPPTPARPRFRRVEARSPPPQGRQEDPEHYVNQFMQRWTTQLLADLQPQLRPLAEVGEALNRVTNAIVTQGERLNHVDARIAAGEGRIQQSLNNSLQAYNLTRELGVNINNLTNHLNVLPRTLEQVREGVVQQNRINTEFGQALANLDNTLQELHQGINTNLQGIRGSLLTQEGQLETLVEIIQAIDLQPREAAPAPARPATAASMHSSLFEFDFGVDDQPQSTQIGRRQGTRTTGDNVPKSARVKMPEAFSGKRGQEAETFLMRMELYFREYTEHFTDTRKIGALLNNMKEGEAQRWARPLLSKYLANENHPYFTTWQTMRQAFLLAFSDPTKKERAVREIGKLIQEGSAQRYATQFRTLAEDLDWGNRALIDRFKEGLKRDVKTELLKQGLTRNLDGWTLEQWIAAAIQIDDLLFSTRAGDQGRSKDQTKRNDLRNKDKPSGSQPRVPTEEIERRRKANLCIKCGKSGHRIKDCTSKEWVLPKKETGKKAEVAEATNEDESNSTESEN